MEYLVIDVGGTFIKYARMNEEAEILEKGKVKTPRTGEGLLEQYLDTLASIYEKYQGQVKGIALSTPGVLDSDSGYCYSGGAMEYVAGNNIAELLKARCHVPVTVENDGKCAALAEVWKGSLKGIKNGGVLILGTGVGGGLIIGGELYKGNQFSAGEFSYLLVDEKKMDVPEGFWGMTNGAEALAEDVSSRTGVPKEELDGVKIFEMIDQGVEGALEGLDAYTKRLAVQIYNLKALLDLDLIAVGGGISQQPLLLELIRKNIQMLCEHHPLLALAPFIPRPQVTVCQFFNDSNLIGALYHHLRKQEEHL